MPNAATIVNTLADSTQGLACQCDPYVNDTYRDAMKPKKEWVDVGVKIVTADGFANTSHLDKTDHTTADLQAQVQLILAGMSHESMTLRKLRVHSMMSGANAFLPTTCGYRFLRSNKKDTTSTNTFAMLELAWQ